MKAPKKIIGMVKDRIATCRLRGDHFLDLGGLDLDELPYELLELKEDLKQLSLADNDIRTLPPLIADFRNLEKLNLSGNALTELPPEVCRLQELRELYLNKNVFAAFPMVVTRLRKLQKLQLASNLLRSIPPEIANLTDLLELSISFNQFELLPEQLFTLTKLVNLAASGNLLESIPDSISRLSSLACLFLSSNRLRTLPVEIGQLKRLERLTLEDNQITDLPRSIQALGMLRELTLHGNDNLGLPVELMGPPFSKSGAHSPPAKPKEILDYYFSSQGEEGMALREMKVLVVGRGGVGKTSVIRRLKGMGFDPQQSETHGMAIESFSLSCDDGQVTARVWDFGGQHVLHAMHEFFFTGSSLYVLVLGEREDTAERDAHYWLQLIRSYAGAVPVVIVMNKSGGRVRDLDLPRRKLEEKYGPIVSWVTTECSYSDPHLSGILNLEKAISKAVGEMEEIRARFPKKWVKIKDWLSKMHESYLDYSSYETRCAELGETDPRKMEELAAFLHNLGVALNYRRDVRLHETTVLRPDWLADGIYALLRANDTRHPWPNAPEGTMTLGRMVNTYAAAEKLGMLRSKDYPPEKHPFLLRLMGAFQLSFPLDEDGSSHLIPALLPVEEPEGSRWISDGLETEIRWEFPVVPAPLLPRLLVRTFGLARKDCIWRRGAIYAYGGAEAKIWEENERYILLRSKKPDSKSGSEVHDDLVRIIRGELREIISEYRNLAVTEQVRWESEWIPRRAAVSLGLCEADDEDENPAFESMS